MALRMVALGRAKDGRWFARKGNYLSEGRVRRRDFDPRRQGIDINLVAHRAGSFEFIFQLLADPAMQTIGHQVAGRVAGDVMMSFIKSVFRRVVGEKADEKIEQFESDGILNSGDIGALVEAIEPAMKAAHTPSIMEQQPLSSSTVTTMSSIWTLRRRITFLRRCEMSAWIKSFLASRALTPISLLEGPLTMIVV
jgi:hypothetical protein